MQVLIIVNGPLSHSLQPVMRSVKYLSINSVFPSEENEMKLCDVLSIHKYGTVPKKRKGFAPLTLCGRVLAPGIEPF